MIKMKLDSDTCKIDLSECLTEKDYVSLFAFKVNEKGYAESFRTKVVESLFAIPHIKIRFDREYTNTEVFDRSYLIINGDGHTVELVRSELHKIFPNQEIRIVP
jgi:hypothetical protein